MIAIIWSVLVFFGVSKGSFVKTTPFSMLTILAMPNDDWLILITTLSPTCASYLGVSPSWMQHCRTLMVFFGVLMVFLFIVCFLVALTK